MTASVAASASSAVEAAALARLFDYLRRAQPRDEHEELIARDAFVTGFRSGARWAIEVSSALADPQFRRAVTVLCELFRETEQ